MIFLQANTLKTNMEECHICYITRSSKSFYQCFRCQQQCCLKCYKRLDKCAFCRKKFPNFQSEYEELIEMSLHELKDMAKLKSNYHKGLRTKKQLIMFIKNNFEIQLERDSDDYYFYYYYDQ